MDRGKTAVLIIAAGSSERLGRPKQLLLNKGVYLLEHTIRRVLDSGVGDSFVVLGAYAEKIKEALPEKELTCTFFENPEWSQGMGTSIACGVKCLGQIADYDRVIICVGDQPFLTSEILQEVDKLALANKGMIIRSKYEKGGGPPVCFPARFFSDLADLEGDDGAKAVVKRYKDKTLSVSFPFGYIDVDREEDLKYWGRGES